jgi:hypothetical protein
MHKLQSVVLVLVVDTEVHLRPVEKEYLLLARKVLPELFEDASYLSR